jgi:hypothetical protein
LKIILEPLESLPILNEEYDGAASCLSSRF